MDIPLWSKFSEYGLVGLVVAALFFIVWKLLTWVMTWVDKQAEQHLKERESWLIIVNQLKSSIELHNMGSMESRRQAIEAHDYQRQEHKEMIEVLGRINGYKK